MKHTETSYLWIPASLAGSAHWSDRKRFNHFRSGKLFLTPTLPSKYIANFGGREGFLVFNAGWTHLLPACPPRSKLIWLRGRISGQRWMNHYEVIVAIVSAKSRAMSDECHFAVYGPAFSLKAKYKQLKRVSNAVYMLIGLVCHTCRMLPGALEKMTGC